MYSTHMCLVGPGDEMLLGDLHTYSILTSLGAAMLGDLQYLEHNCSGAAVLLDDLQYSQLHGN